ncbi:TetR/AcrR family transcriptional regulator [Phytoactinopolyspora mesophila]|uniref:TetR family transcriptional regulator n=1 Tax=Phytoactinopolyspora mesophila TaxID=2650750 RepID=A0A7K3MCI2_9ACTN|nr:TetR/AcrR family transcriptional regulator [Phytoactinopolyspora mesophila]NDL60747.1 TetR family transcriptional regulator [Phytoactinopolyspora mesophila]
MTFTSEPRVDSGVRGRTRRAILDAAAALWSRDPSASLGDIADHAEISRSTLHRYFPERQDLTRALLADSKASMDAALASTGPEDHPAVQALENSLRALVDAGDRIVFLFSDMHRLNHDDVDWGEDDETLTRLIRRAQAEDALDPGLDPTWIESAYYALVYVAAMSASSGAMPRHVAADQAVRTFLHGVAGRATP